MATLLPPEYQQTVRVAPLAQLETPPPSTAPTPALRSVALVEGSQPGLSREVEGVLRERLRLAALLLAFGFFVFFIKNLFFLDLFQEPKFQLLFWGQVGVLVLETTIGVRLCQKCRHMHGHLRATEAIVFGAPALFFVLWSYVMLSEAAAGRHAPTIVYPWVLLAFNYALFIPNAWQRAAAVIGAFVTAPIVIILAMVLGSETFGDFAAIPQIGHMLLESCLVMPVTGVVAVWGVHAINRLRREAFEAKQLGQYKLKRKLGSGGMGDVYLAEHVLLKRPCAIKVIRAEKAGDPQALARFEREVRETARLTHWNTVEIYDYGRTDDGTFYYVMEYLPGMNLEQLVEMHGPQPAERVIHLLTQVCDALAEAHRKGLIHRDIKPANVFAARRGGIYDVAKLLDFGLVKPSAHNDELHVTQDGMVAGSPLYMSPEQALGDAPDERSDIYALGLVAYFLLTGRPPFDGDKAIKVLLAHAHDKAELPSQFVADVPRDLELVVMRCLEKSPDRRFQNVEELRDALDSCASAGDWTRARAEDWWQNFGCPEKKQLDAEVCDGVTVCA